MKALLAGILALCAAVGAFAGDRVVVAASSSLQESGFLGYLEPLLKTRADLSVEWKAAEDSQVIQLARAYQVDAVLVSSPEAEDQLMREGVGALMLRVMARGPQEQFSILVLNPGAGRSLRFDAAIRLLRWLTSPEGQGAIARFASAGVAPYQPSAGTETCPACQAQL
jgi:ABC-type tungstate transport system permease subunit